MENESIEYLINIIIKNLKEIYYFKEIDESIKEFLKKDIEQSKKERVIELLYLYQLYKNGYISPDPRMVNNMQRKVSAVLKVQNESELDDKVEEVQRIVDMLKEAENNPLRTAKKRKEDMEEFRGSVF